MKQNIILIGFMGVGKGTTARAYAKRYNIFNIDTDDLIESKENRSIPKIFKKEGEEYFRALEQDVANWIECCVDNTLISCGGGFYKVKNLKNLGVVIFLDASFDWIYNRLKSAKNSKKKLAKRPLFSNLKKAKALYKERKASYRSSSHIIVNVEDKSLEEVLEEINTKAKEFFRG